VTIWHRKHKRKTPSQAFTRSKQIYCNGRSLKYCGTVHLGRTWQDYIHAVFTCDGLTVLTWIRGKQHFTSNAIWKVVWVSEYDNTLVSFLLSLRFMALWNNMRFSCIKVEKISTSAHLNQTIYYTEFSNKTKLAKMNNLFRSVQV